MDGRGRRDAPGVERPGGRLDRGETGFERLKIPSCGWDQIRGVLDGRESFVDRLKVGRGGTDRRRSPGCQRNATRERVGGRPGIVSLGGA